MRDSKTVTVVIIRSTIFWDIALCSSVEVSRCSSETSVDFTGLHGDISHRIVMLLQKTECDGRTFTRLDFIHKTRMKVSKPTVDMKHGANLRLY